MAVIWKRVRRLIRWLDQQEGSWPGIFLSALRQTISPESSMVAAAIAYFALFSFFPLVFFTSVIVGTWLEPLLDRSQIIGQLDFVAPALAYLLENQLERIVGLEQTVTGVALIALLWSSSSIFYVLTRTLNRIWGASSRRPVWQHRGMAVLTLLVISSVLLTASIAYSTAVSFLEVLMPSQLRQLSGLGSQMAALGVDVLLFGLLYRFLPRFRVEWRDVWLGAVGAGLLWEVVKQAFFFYTTHYLAQPNLTELIYGSVVTIIAFMAWSYASSLIFIFGAYLNVAYRERRERGEGAGQR